MADFDSRLDALLDRYFAGRLDAAAKAELQAWLRREAAARRRFWRVAQLHGDLHDWGAEYAGRQAAQQDESLVVAPADARRPRAAVFPGCTWVAAAMVAAAVLVLSFLVVAGLRSKIAGRAPTAAAAVLATVSYQRAAGWSAGQVLASGDYLVPDGAVRFETRAGAAVSVAGPARFRLVSAERIQLHEGRLTARMLHPGATLTVRSGELEVTDLGTAFGIDARPDQPALVSVFDGLVAVRRRAHEGELRLARGESLVPEPARLRPAPYDPNAFRELWPLTAGIDEASALVEFLPPGPLLRPLREYEANDRVFLLPEKQHGAASGPLPLDLAPDVRAWPQSAVSPYPFPRGQTASSYLVFFQPAPAAKGGEPRRLTGEITFQQRVLGILCSDEGLEASDAVFGVAGADYATPGQRRGLEEADKENYRGRHLAHDSIEIAPDGRTVRFDFYVSNEREQMRILVAASPSP